MVARRDLYICILSIIIRQGIKMANLLVYTVIIAYVNFNIGDHITLTFHGTQFCT